MKITIQWILAAILVILILLVGAYALTNGKNTPATNATATPTTTITPTPTPTPVAPSTTPTTVASVTPTAIASSAPTPTPTVSGASGVKKTEFGYYITYPPFSNNEVHVNPNYVESQGDVVYFSPTSATIAKYYDLDGAVETPDAVAVVHRSGNLSGTTHVTIKAAVNANIDDLGFAFTGDSESADVIFGPGESEKTVGIYVYQDHLYSSAGQMTLTITNVDGVDSIGSNNVFTLTVHQLSVGPSPSPSPSITPSGPTVTFQDSQGSYDVNTNLYDQRIYLVRNGDLSHTLTVNVVLDQNTNDLTAGEAVTFSSGEATTVMYFAAYYRDVNENENPTYSYSIAPRSDYIVGTPGTYIVNLHYRPKT